MEVTTYIPFQLSQKMFLSKKERLHRARRRLRNCRQSGEQKKTTLMEKLFLAR